MEFDEGDVEETGNTDSLEEGSGHPNPKEKDSAKIKQLCHISVLNIIIKVFFSVLAQRLTVYLEKNNYIDSSMKREGLPSLSECMDHISMI